MKRLICAAIVVVSLFIETDLNSSYMDKPYIPEYPCVIMELPGHYQYVMTEPCGEIIKEEATK